MFSEFQYHTCSFYLHWPLLKSYFVAGTWKTMLVVYLISVLFSSLLAEPQLCLSTQCVQIKKVLFPHLPGNQGWPSTTVLVRKTELVFLSNFSFLIHVQSLPTFPLLSFCLYYSSHLEYRCEGRKRSSPLVTMGINALC